MGGPEFSTIEASDLADDRSVNRASSLLVSVEKDVSAFKARQLPRGERRRSAVVPSRTGRGQGVERTHRYILNIRLIGAMSLGEESDQNEENSSAN